MRSRTIRAVVAAAAILTAVTAALFTMEYGHEWAHEWLPNFVAEWTGILFAIGVFEMARERERERELEPLRSRCYRSILDKLDHIGLNATSLLERFVVPPLGSAAPNESVNAVLKADEAFRHDTVPPGDIRDGWATMLEGTTKRLADDTEPYQPFIASSALDPLLDLLEVMRTSARQVRVVVGSASTSENYVPIASAFAETYAAVERQLDAMTRTAMLRRFRRPWRR
jgi:hypothetical protein